MGVQIPVSPYYPPRAGSAKRWRGLWYRLRRSAQLERVKVLTARGSTGRLFPWLLVPGTEQIACGQAFTGWAVVSAWIALLVVAVAALGTGWGVGTLLAAAALHSVSAASFWLGWFSVVPMLARFWRACVWAWLVVLLLYGIVAPMMMRVVVRPIEVGGGVSALINPRVPASSVRRGDWVAYYLPNNRLGFERVLALEGETIRFHPDSFEVGGVRYRKVSPSMPENSAVQVPSGKLFLWPVGARLGGGGDLTETLMPLAFVAEGSVMGRAYDRWPWARGRRPQLVKLDDGRLRKMD